MTDPTPGAAYDGQVQRVRVEQHRKVGIQLAASAARVATGEGSIVDVGASRRLRLFLNITATSGVSSTLDVEIQGRDPVSGAWIKIGNFPQKNAVGSDTLVVDAPPMEVRARWVIAGTTPSFTFSLGGTAEA